MDSIRFNEEDFNGYLEQLIESGRLDLMQSGITKLVIDKGYDALSPKQRKVFDYMIDTNTVVNVVHVIFLGAKCLKLLIMVAIVITANI